MRAAVLHAPGDVRIEERERPQPGPREVLVQVTAVGVCGSDVHYYEHGRIGPFVVEAPLVLGHESAGRVVELGEGATDHSVGDRVTLEPGVPCGRCRECRAGRYNLCGDVVFFATPPIDGAFADFVAIHEDFAFALPEALSDEEGALMEPLSVGVWACRKAGVSAGDRVLVTGAGPIGLLAMQCALAYGATEVIVSDVNERRLALARRTGATRVVRAGEPLDFEADALIECSGPPRRAHRRDQGAAPGGRRGARRDGARGGGHAAAERHPDPRDLGHRHLPLRQHLPDRDRPGRRGPGSTSRRSSPATSGSRTPRRRCAPAARTPPASSRWWSRKPA